MLFLLRERESNLNLCQCKPKNKWDELCSKTQNGINSEVPLELAKTDGPFFFGRKD